MFFNSFFFIFTVQRCLLCKFDKMNFYLVLILLHFQEAYKRNVARGTNQTKPNIVVAKPDNDLDGSSQPSKSKGLQY